MLLTILAASVLPAAIAGCGEDDPVAPPPLVASDAGPAPDVAVEAAPAEPTGVPDEARPLVPASKLDLLLVVDDSAGMADKAGTFAASLGALLRGVARLKDVHVGIITTSLGTPGGNVCPARDGGAHLRTTGAGGAPVAAASTGVLSYTGGDIEAFIKDVQNVVRGTASGEQLGCGFEAQLEATYRFLIQPDPYAAVKIDEFSIADLGGPTEVDVQLLKERKAFLRPDSAVAVVLLTDEDDSTYDPMAIGGQGFSFGSRDFPGSKVRRGPANNGTTAARGASICATAPTSEDCTSCGFAATCDPAKATCQKLKADVSCTTSGVAGQKGDGYDGFYPPTDDSLNVRFHRMKERFGIDPQFPVARYVDGFTRSVVPDRAGEHPSTVGADGRRSVQPYGARALCRNPLFAATLPESATEDLCARERGPRSNESVLFTVIGGVPPLLVTETPDWVQILGKNPSAYDYSGQSKYMVQSRTPRDGIPGPAPLGSNGTDPVVGRDWDTQREDLQYACTFALPAPKPCAANDVSCECSPGIATNPPLCNTNNAQVRGKAYPSLRPLQVVRDLGARGVFGSICAPTYDATMTSLGTRLTTRLVP